MRRWPPRVGSCLGKPTNLLCFAGIGNLTARAAHVAASCSVVWGFGFRRTGLWARPRPGALGGALVMPKKTWFGPVLPPPKFPGVAMESCLWQGQGPCALRLGYWLSVVIGARCVVAVRSHRPKAEILACFKENNTRRPLFFSACADMVLVNNLSARKKSRREGGGPAQRLQVGDRQRERETRGHIPPPPLTYFERLQPPERAL
jgi:hypothetical protein